MTDPNKFAEVIVVAPGLYLRFWAMPERISRLLDNALKEAQESELEWEDNLKKKEVPLCHDCKIA